MTGTPPAAAAARGADRHTSDPPSRPAAAASRRALIVSPLGPATHSNEKVRSLAERRYEQARDLFERVAPAGDSTDLPTLPTYEVVD